MVYRRQRKTRGRKTMRRRSFKRRSFKKKTFKAKKRTGYDGTYYAKCITNVNIYSATLTKTFSIGWGQNGTSGPAGAYLPDVSEFGLLARQFREWRLMGLKIIWQPVALLTDGSTTRKYSVPVQSASQVGTQFSITETQMQRECDYKTFPIDSVNKRYVSCKKYYGPKSEKWLLCNPGSSLPAMYSLARTDYLFNSIGLTSSDILGSFRIIWYCAFRDWCYN